MWKSFFYFSGSQRAGIVVLSVLIILVFVADRLIPVWFPEKPVTADSVFQKEFELFSRSLQSLDSLRKLERESRYSNRYQANNQSFQKDNISLFSFDPNVLDSAGFTHLGLSPRVAGNILRYRAKGGFFRDADAFSKVYGITAERFAELKPYIRINIQDKYLKDSSKLAGQHENKHVPVVVELNTADTADLIQVRGIGRYTALKIVRFRNMSGGFFRKEQMLDIEGITPEMYGQVQEFITVDPAIVRKIKINTASIEKLRAHPYLNFYQAKEIYELRRRKGKLNHVAELRKLQELDNSTLEKVAEYFSFE
jgi:DNA uptake protein ComE-like DNA-binding protein